MSEDDVEFVKKQNKSVRNDFFSILIVLAAFKYFIPGSTFSTG